MLNGCDSVRSRVYIEKKTCEVAERCGVVGVPTQRPVGSPARLANFHCEQGGEVGNVIPCCPIERWAKQSCKLLAQTDTVKQQGQVIRHAVIKGLDGQMLQSRKTSRDVCEIGMNDR